MEVKKEFISVEKLNIATLEIGSEIIIAQKLELPCIEIKNDKKLVARTVLNDGDVLVYRGKENEDKNMWCKFEKKGNPGITYLFLSDSLKNILIK